MCFPSQSRGPRRGLSGKDRLTEARDVGDQEYGRKRAIETIRRRRQEPAEGMIQELPLSVYEFTSGRNLIDDITAVVVKVVE